MIIWEKSLNSILFSYIKYSLLEIANAIAVTIHTIVDIYIYI